MRSRSTEQAAAAALIIYEGHAGTVPSAFVSLQHDQVATASCVTVAQARVVHTLSGMAVMAVTPA